MPLTYWWPCRVRKHRGMFVVTPYQAEDCQREHGTLESAAESVRAALQKTLSAEQNGGNIVICPSVHLDIEDLESKVAMRVRVDL